MTTSIWIVLIVCLSISWIITTWVRARHGYPVEDTFGFEVKPLKTVEFEKLSERLEKDLAERDNTIALLESRVRVLERIVTDHRSNLHEEIHQLDA